MNTYNGSPGYQQHSDTSRAAAMSLENATEKRAMVLKVILDAGLRGATADEIKETLLAQEKVGLKSQVPPRLRELELKGRVFKTTNKRMTTSKRPATVYIAKEFKDHPGIEIDTKHTKPAPHAAVDLDPYAASYDLRQDIKKALDHMKATGYGSEHQPTIDILEKALAR